MRPVIVAATFATGVVLADAIRPPPALSLALGLTGAVLLMSARLLHRGKEPEVGELLRVLAVKAVVCLLAGMCLVAFSASGFRHARMQRSVLSASPGRRVVLEGKIASEPKMFSRYWLFELRSYAWDAGRLPRGRLIALRHAERVQVGLWTKRSSLQIGDTVRVIGTLKPLQRSGASDQHLYFKSITVRLSASSIRVLGPSNNAPLRWANSLRDQMRAVAVGNLPRPEAGLVLGITTGDDDLIPDSVSNDFRDAGLTHLLAVSGTNVALALGSVALLLHLLSLPMRLRAAVLVILLTFFVVLTRWEPSVLRAALMASVALYAPVAGRRYGIGQSLSLSFIVLLAIDPFLLHSIAFQLSFAATAGIVWLTPALRRVFGTGRVAQAFSITIAAQFAVAPILVAHFGKLSMSAPVANMVALPAVGPATVLGLAGGAASVVSVPVSEFIFRIAGVPATILRRVAAWFADMPGSSLYLGHSSMLLSWGIWAMLLVALVIASRGGGARRAFLGIGLCLVLVLAAYKSRPVPTPVGLRATFFSVGQGGSLLLESPGGARVLIDGGPEPDLLVARLAQMRMRRFDAVVLTHPHADHVNGLPAVLERYRARLVLETGVRNREASLDGSFIRIARARGIPVRRPHFLETFAVGDLKLEVLNHAPQAAALHLYEEDGHLNNSSLVLRASWRGRCILITGDVEEQAQEELLERKDKLDCPVMKVPHHGSARILPGFAAAAHARFAVISVGRNEYGHPSDKSLALLRRSSTHVFRTDRDGEVTIVIGEKSISARTDPRLALQGNGFKP